MNEDAALILLFGLVASGQIRLPRIAGWRKIATVLTQHAPRSLRRPLPRGGRPVSDLSKVEKIPVLRGTFSRD